MNKQRVDSAVIKSVSLRLKQLREAKGISQETLYIDTDIHIARIEAGKSNITISTLSALCKYLDIS
ncbi:MAG TPA: helix-turn-helix transcriptional regulator, partial [Paludibacteraceae bacterium]|nr:helix-turn-helix transcriptional regulator [Paludibacteraceae bacterium]